MRYELTDDEWACDLPDNFGPYTTCYNRFVRWRRAGAWARIIDALATAHDVSVQMIDTSTVRVHQHGACIIQNRRQSMGRSRGGLTSKIHAVVDTNGENLRLFQNVGRQKLAQGHESTQREVSAIQNRVFPDLLVR